MLELVDLENVALNFTDSCLVYLSIYLSYPILSFPNLSNLSNLSYLSI